LELISAIAALEIELGVKTGAAVAAAEEVLS